jgi:pimeloyl-ACP methyl ester carboxylesterase
MKTNPRLPADKAAWLAERWARPDADNGSAGRWKIQGHAAHKVPSAHIFRADELLEIYQRITAPLLAVEADSDSLSKWSKGAYTLADYHQRLKNVADARTAVISDAGHMLHHDQPEQLALLIEDFLA